MRAQRRAHLPQLVMGRAAGGAPGEMLFDLAGLRAGDAARGVATELLPDRTTPARLPVGGEMRLEIRGPQADPGTPGQRGRRVRAEPEVSGERRGRGALDLGLPQHGPPPFGERGERPGDQGRLGRPGLGIGVAPGPGGEFLVGHRDVPAGALPLPGHPACHRHQVRAHVVPGTAPPPDRLQHPEEGLRGDVVGLGRVRDQAAREPPDGGLVRLEQLPEGGIVTGTEAVDQPRAHGVGRRPVRHDRHPLPGRTASSVGWAFG